MSKHQDDPQAALPHQLCSFTTQSTAPLNTATIDRPSRSECSERDSQACDTSSIELLRKTITAHFPTLWPAVDTGLAACATLLLKDNVNPIALIYVGPPSSGKTTVANMFVDAQMNGAPLCYRSDNFTPAAFVSHAANVSRSTLASVDLLPRIKHKVLITPELAPIFRGKEDELTKGFAVLTRVLDGQGYQSDSGTHGQRGYTGDYLFTWIGCTTPFPPRTLEVMNQLGSRLFFYTMETHVVTVETLAQAEVTTNGVKLQDCQQLVQRCLDQLFRQGVRSVEWDSTGDPPHVRDQIARLARLLSVLRTPYMANDCPPQPESPHRAHAVIYNLARGHALAHGRTALTSDDVPLLATIARSSADANRWTVLLALARKGGPLTVAEARLALGVKSPDTARKAMRDLAWLGLTVLEEPGNGKTAITWLHPNWSWCASEEFLALFPTQPITE